MTTAAGRGLGGAKAGGKPRAGRFVFVYRDKGMIGRPEAETSTGTRGEGREACGASGQLSRDRARGAVKGLTFVVEQVW